MQKTVKKEGNTRKKPLKEKIIELEKQLAEKEKALQEMRELLQRVQAEFENFGKRTEKEKKQFQENANAALIKKLLPLLDSLEGATQHGNENEKKGLLALYKQFLEILKKEGLEEIQTLGKSFDPTYCECIAYESQPKEKDDTVLEVLQKGYLFKEKVLRPAKVKINRKT
jgi:molecular chaperone GrpE